MTIDIESMPYMTASTFNTKVLPELRKKPLSESNEYVAIPYDSCENLYAKPIVVTAMVPRPTIIRQPRSRTNRNPMALAVPELTAITMPLLQVLTRVVTSFITVRHLHTRAWVAGPRDGAQQQRIEARNELAATNGLRRPDAA